MKKILVALGALVVVLAIALAVLLSQLDKVVKVAVEEAGTEVTQVPVTLEQVDISARKGVASLSGFSVANPAGFSAEPAIGLGGISVTLDTDSLREDVIVVREILIDAPTFLYEVIEGKTNIGTIQDNIKQFTASLPSSEGGSAQASEPAPQEPEQGAGKKVIVERLALTGGMITVRADVIKDGEKQVALPDVEIRDIGKNEGGLQGSALAARLLDEINSRIAEAVADAQIDGLREEAKARLRDKVNEKLKSWFGN